MTKKILIVEDEEDILELLSTIFESSGDYRIFCAKDGEEGLRIARAENPDVILLDIQLPRINGYEVCKLVKSGSAMFRTKILIVTGKAQNYDWQKAREAGADGYVTKPFRPLELVEKVEGLLSS